MKVFAHTLFAVSVLVFGFLLGIRYEARVQSVNEVDTLVRVQKTKITTLRDQNLELRTVVLLREFLDEERIRLPRETVNGMAGSIARASEHYSLPPEMIMAVIRTESAFDANALSNKGAVGLMQILPSTAQEIAQELRMDWRGDDLLRDPGANIEMGTYYLTKLIAQFNNVAVALTAYNHGPGRVSELNDAKAELPMGYAEKVLSHYTP